MRFVLMGGLAFLALTYFVLVVLGWLSAENDRHEPHNGHCDCMTCGRKRADEYVKKYDSTIRREAKSRQTGK